MPSLRPAQEPAQVASVPHDVRFPCGPPEATAVHCPRWPTMSQAMQGWVQAESQQ